MSVALRPYLSAGLALASVGVIAAAPLAAQQQSVRLANDQVALTAGTISNVLTNTVNAVLNIPASELDGVKRLTAAMYSSQNWFIYSPVNVLGADPSNPEMVKGLMDMLIPFPTLSRPFGDQLNAWFEANFPMNAGCTGFPPCPDLNSLLNVMFKVPGTAFYDQRGYTFAEPLTPTNNPVSTQEGQWNADLGQTGVPVPWYAETVKLDPFESLKSLVSYLGGTPGKVTIPTAKQIVDTYTAFAKSLWNSWNPFIPQGVLWNPDYSLSAFVLRPFAKALCPTCNPYDPFMPIGWAPGGWVPDAFTYVPTSPTNPFQHYAVSHGPVPVEYDFNYKPEPVVVTAAAVAAAPQGTGSSDSVAPEQTSLTAVTQALPTAASARASRAKVQPATAVSASGEAASVAATPAAEAPAVEVATAKATDSSPRASRSGLAKSPISRTAK